MANWIQAFYKDPLNKEIAERAYAFTAIHIRHGKNGELFLRGHRLTLIKFMGELPLEMKRNASFFNISRTGKQKKENRLNNIPDESLRTAHNLIANEDLS